MTSWLITGPTVEPIDLADAKRQCRVEDSVGDMDQQLLSYIQAAREWAENFTGRALLTQTWELKFDAFPSCIVIPRPPVASVTSITYIDTNGATQTLSASLYTTDLPTGPTAQPGRIVAAYGVTWPSTRPVPNAVTVRVVCGWADPTSVPEALKNAMRAKIATFYMQAEDVIVGTNVMAFPQVSEHLAWPYKVWL